MDILIYLLFYGGGGEGELNHSIMYFEREENVIFSRSCTKLNVTEELDDFDIRWFQKFLIFEI